MNTHDNIAFIHKGCGGEITKKSCAWDDNFNGCSDCDKHEFMDGFEIEVKVVHSECCYCKETIYECDDFRGSRCGDYHWHNGCTS